MARSSRSPAGEPWQATRITGLDSVDPGRVSQAGLDVFLTGRWHHRFVTPVFLQGRGSVSVGPPIDRAQPTGRCAAPRHAASRRPPVPFGKS